MTYRLIKGEVRLFYESNRHVGSRPDGDSAWFLPDNPAHMDDIGGRTADTNAGGFAQLRFEGIDALELHYKGANHQLEGPTVAARDFMLASLGFDLAQMEYAPSDDIATSVRDTSPVAVRAHIMTRAIDPFGRPVAFLFSGNAPEQSGSEVFLDVQRLDHSVNARLMRQGHVYPGFYTAREVAGELVGGLPRDLRNRLTLHAITAYNAGRGVWADDWTTWGARITRESDLTGLAIWPKLYRRLLAWYHDAAAAHANLHDFRDWLEADSGSRNDTMLVLSLGELRNLSDTLDLTAQTLTLLFEPEDLVIVPR